MASANRYIRYHDCKTLLWILGLASPKLSFRTLLCSFCFLITFLSFLLILSNDVELNPGPKNDNSKRNFSIAHWNLNSIAAQNFVKLSQKLTIHCIAMILFVCLRHGETLQPEAVVRRCSVKKMLLKILQNPQENTCARVSILIKLQAWV